MVSVSLVAWGTLKGVGGAGGEEWVDRSGWYGTLTWIFGKGKVHG